jgi:23S rRNA-/tRNA-specific pseudouridylate synthase
MKLTEQKLRSIIREELVTEASRSKVFKAVKKGSYPVTLVVIKDAKVIEQKLVNTPEAVPAAFNVMQEKHPNARIEVEDRTGKRLFSESK